MPIRFLKPDPVKRSSESGTGPNGMDKGSSERAMTRTGEILRALTLPPADFVRSLFKRREGVVRLSDPRHSDVPVLRRAEIAAV